MASRMDGSVLLKVLHDDRELSVLGEVIKERGGGGRGLDEEDQDLWASLEVVAGSLESCSTAWPGSSLAYRRAC